MILADIKAAYHTLGLQPQDREFLRFLWIPNYGDEPSKHIIGLIELRFLQIPFGIVPSSFLLGRD